MKPRRAAGILPQGLLFPALLLAGVGGCASSPTPELAAAAPTDTTAAEVPQVGPAHGALVLAGGGQLDEAVWERFVELAGGRDARIVVLPTANTDRGLTEGVSAVDYLRKAGARDLVVLHTRDRREADSEEFVEPLTQATGVWIPGGRQWRLVDAYLHTRTHRELFKVLERGGVVGGTSAGASIQASYLARGDPRTNEILMAPGYEEGFGFLSGAAVDQHLLARNRQNDLWELLQLRPSILGIGVDEGTAVVVKGDRAKVVGPSRVVIYDGLDPERRPVLMGDGDVYDLGERDLIRGQAQDELQIQFDPELDPYW